MNDPLDITAVRQMVMGEYWQLVHQGVDRRVARKKAVELVSTAVDMTSEQLEKELSDDMLKTKKATENRVKVAQETVRLGVAQPAFVDDNVNEFYDDLLEDSPTERLFWLRDQLKDTEVGKARACLYDTAEEAQDCRKLVVRVVHMLGWKNSKKNPGFYTEVLSVGAKWKLRVKRLR